MTRTGRTLVAAVLWVGLTAAGLPGSGFAESPAPADAESLNWPQFRGPDGLPVSEHRGLATTWSRTENVEWAVDVPGMGWSSPIVWEGRIFVTSATSDTELKQPSLGVDFSNEFVAELVAQGKTEEEIGAAVGERDIELPAEVALSYRLFCFDLASGAMLWEREFHNGPPPVGRHRKNSYTSETAATDGEAVFVYVAHLGLFAFDLEGKALWKTRLDAHKVYFDFGGGASPALGDDRVFILNDNQDGSFLAAFDKRSGKRLWQTERPGLGDEQSRSGWSTPFVWRNEQRTEIVTNGPGVAIGYDLEGNELWRMGRLNGSAIQTPFAWGGHVYLASGAARGDDRPLVAIRAGATGDITLPENVDSSEHVAWFDRIGGGTYLPTPLAYAGALYVLTDKGILSKHDAATGERIYRTRIHPRARNFTASPWAYNGHVFCINEDGETFVIGTGDEFELVGTNALEEFTQATPALSGARLLIRTQSRLYSIRSPATS